MPASPTPLEDLLRTEAPQVLGALTRRFGRFDVAEDAVQEALLVASQRWPAEGIPAEPRTWLIRVGYRKMVDLLRADGARSRREHAIGTAELAMQYPDRAAPLASTYDDSLTLLVLCCHPCLTATSQAALTLRAVGGLRTAEIAHAYGTTEATMAARISRAKQQLQHSGARFTPPTPTEEARYAAVRQVLYLMFNEGYVVTAGHELGRVDLAQEAIRLTRMLYRKRPDDPEAAGLLALMLLTEARRAARTGQDGALVPLEEQDRSRWDTDLIAEGTRIIDQAWNRGTAGPYRLQAAIAAIHAQAPTAADTDWPQIAALYLWLERLTPTNPIRLSRVVAVAEAFGGERGLNLLNRLDTEHNLAHDPLVQQRVLAIRAHLRERVGDPTAAAQDYRDAARLTANQAEQRYLLARAADLA